MVAVERRGYHIAFEDPFPWSPHPSACDGSWAPTLGERSTTRGCGFELAQNIYFGVVAISTPSHFFLTFRCIVFTRVWMNHIITDFTSRHKGSNQQKCLLCFSMRLRGIVVLHVRYVCLFIFSTWTIVVPSTLLFYYLLCKEPIWSMTTIRCHQFEINLNFKICYCLGSYLRYSWII